MRKILCFIVLLIGMCGYSQESKPKIWISSFAKKSRKASLNGHSRIKLRKGITSTVNKMGVDNHIFAVYKSSRGKEELPFLGILGRDRNLFIGSQYLYVDKKEKIAGRRERTGELLDISIGNFGKNRMFINTSQDNADVYELLVYGYMTKKHEQEVRTYLAIKYGIDLLDTKQYYYEPIGELWKTCEGDKNIFGIGRMNKYGLEQLKSEHSRDQDIELSFSDRGIKEIEEGSIVLLGRNNSVLEFNKEGKSKREWTIQNTEDTSINILFKTDKIKNNYKYRLEVGEDKYEETTTLEGRLAFKNIEISSSTHKVVLIELGASKTETTNEDLKDAEEIVEVPIEEEKAPDLSDVSFARDWKVYPNPVNLGNYITVSFSFAEKTEVKLAMYSVTGKLVYSSLKMMINKDGEVRIPAQYKGKYILLAYINGRIEMKKILVK